ncbi:SnoaL-like domain-containing protein [Raineyella antarctica]|uniref:SnoaL-like domain-containing protein n=1 Tax=Raineyella antarctica TaxID=1577474 RepID=A0A1G6HE20_9ACTN|nr:nuclear transport factor 2 family protein [Raineyella antarctica]SDB92461.1 SnoaL-like domain-containing protein [Raineyella antarctica]
MDISGDLNALFETYSKLLSEGDVEHIARLYAYPAMVVAPHARLVVQDAGQTRGYFSGGLDKYAQQGIVSSHPSVSWSDQPSRGIAVAYVNFSNHDAAGNEVNQERYLYQLVQVDGWWKISVVTPLLA